MSDKIWLIDRGLNVAPIAWALQADPGVWNRNTSRTEDPSSPHHGLDDIWVRFGTDPEGSDAPHESQWYPTADELNLKPFVMGVFQALGGTRLGGVLITRIPPGATCKPHKDPGWHARYYEKFGVQIASAPGQRFCFDGEELETRPGDVFGFDNAHTHWVTNPTAHERVTMIICLRRD